MRKVGAKSGLRPRWKRAIVKLREGDKIDEIFEG
jgi:ribosomal protein L23